MGGTTGTTTGLSTLGARQYDPVTGRFVSAGRGGAGGEALPRVLGLRRAPRPKRVEEGHELLGQGRGYISLGALGLCLVASAGACAVAGVALAGLNYGAHGEKYGYGSRQALVGLGIDLVGAVGGGYLSKGFGSFGRPGAWNPLDMPSWKAPLFERVGSGEGIGRHVIGPRDGSSKLAWTSRLSRENLLVNAVVTTPVAGGGAAANCANTPEACSG